MASLYVDALGFAGAAMIRRTLGLRTTSTSKLIVDPDRRADCERRNLRLARELAARARQLCPTSPR